MGFEGQRKKLFDEVWKEPMTTVAKRYDLSDNGLRKRCIKLEIPLPPAGYWAKVQAGKPVPTQPELPPYKTISVQKESGDIYNTSTMGLELIDISDHSCEQLQELGGLELLTPESKERLLDWCKKIEVPKRIAQYDPLIIDYQAEIEYRKTRDKEHKFRDIFWYSTFYTCDNSKIIYRENKAVLPIFVSDKQAKRAFKIVDILIRLVRDLEGTVAVKSGEQDNATFRLLGHAYSFRLTEIMVKRRSLLAPGNTPVFKPMYEKVFSGKFEIEFKEVLDQWNNDNNPKTFKFVDSIDNPIENQIGDIFIVLCKTANETVITDIIIKRERKLQEIEQERHKAIEEEKRRYDLQIEEQIHLKKHLVESIEQQMEGWFMSQKLHKYAQELEAYILACDDEITKEQLSVYIKLVQHKAEKINPVREILNKVKNITTQKPEESEQ